VANPLISVIVPVYNAAAYLEAGLASVLAQEGPSFEVIAVDDGSTDGSGELCDRIAASDPRVRVIHKENGGAGSARNRGIDEARGRYLAFPDGDDICMPGMLATLAAAAEKSGAQVTLCGYQAFDENGDGERVWLPAQTLQGRATVRRFAASQFPRGVAGYPWNKLYRADFIRENRIRYPDMRRFQDGMFNLQVFDRAERVRVIPDVLYRYKINTQTEIFQKFPPDMLELLKQITEGFFDALERWGIEEEEPMGRIRPFFLNGAVGCVDCLYSPRWHCSRKERKAWLKRLHLDPTFRRCAGPEEGLSRYAALIVRLVMGEKYRRALAAARIKLFLKKHCRRLFRTLK